MNSTVAFRQLEDIIELKNERIKSLEAKVNENQVQNFTSFVISYLTLVTVFAGNSWEGYESIA